MQLAHLCLEVGLLLEQPCLVAIAGDPVGPVVGQRHGDGALQLHSTSSRHMQASATHQPGRPADSIDVRIYAMMCDTSYALMGNVTVAQASTLTCQRVRSHNHAHMPGCTQ